MRFDVGDGIGGRAERPRSKCRNRERDTPFSAQLAIGFNAGGPCAAKLQESKLLGTRRDLPVSACLVTLSAVNDIVRSEYGSSLPQSRHTS